MFQFRRIDFRSLPRKIASLTEEEVTRQVASAAIVIDIRSAAEFSAGHFPGSLNVCLESGSFRECVELFVSRVTVIVLAVENSTRAQRAASELIQAGYSRIAGFIRARDLRAADKLTSLNVFDLKSTLSRGRKPAILDVRTTAEWRLTRIPESTNIPLSELFSRSGELCPNEPLVVLCDNGFESALAASWLQSNGFDSVQHLTGGMRAYARGVFGDPSEDWNSSPRRSSAAFGF